MMCLLDILKNNFDEVDEDMCQSVDGPFYLFSASRESKKVTFMKSLK
jgi:hypothetical protein